MCVGVEVGNSGPHCCMTGIHCTISQDFFLLNLYIYMYVCVPVKVYLQHMCPGALEDQRASDPLELKLQTVRDHLMRVLGTKSRSSE